MDLQATIMGIICVALVTVPFIYIYINQRKRSAILLKDFRRLAEQRQLNISQHDFWDPSYALGVDTAGRKLLYAMGTGGKDRLVLEDLSAVKQCRVSNIRRDSDDGTQIERLELVLTHSDPRCADTVLEFYSREGNMVLNDELSLCEKWAEIVKANLGTGQQGALS